MLMVGYTLEIWQGIGSGNPFTNVLNVGRQLPGPYGFNRTVPPRA
jgi:hypothetical protein